MEIYLFASCNNYVRGFTFDQTGSALPKEYAP